MEKMNTKSDFELSEYKGNTIIKLNVRNGYSRMCFGKGKAKLIMKNIKAIKKLANQK